MIKITKLKIKNDVEITKLFKYNFTFHPYYLNINAYFSYYMNEQMEIVVMLESREIFISMNGVEGNYEIDIPGVIYDLIKDELIEKVSED